MIEQLLALPPTCANSSPTHCAPRCSHRPTDPPRPGALLCDSANAYATATTLARLAGRGITGAAVALALALDAAAHAAAQVSRPELVSTGPAVEGLHERDTARAYKELVQGARGSLRISTFTYHDGSPCAQVAHRADGRSPGLARAPAHQHRPATGGHDASGAAHRRIRGAALAARLARSRKRGRGSARQGDRRRRRHRTRYRRSPKPRSSATSRLASCLATARSPPGSPSTSRRSSTGAASCRRRDRDVPRRSQG